MCNNVGCQSVQTIILKASVPKTIIKREKDHMTSGCPLTKK